MDVFFENQVIFVSILVAGLIATFMPNHIKVEKLLHARLHFLLIYQAKKTNLILLKANYFKLLYNHKIFPSIFNYCLQTTGTCDKITAYYKSSLFSGFQFLMNCEKIARFFI